MGDTHRRLTELFSCVPSRRAAAGLLIVASALIARPNAAPAPGRVEGYVRLTAAGVHAVPSGVYPSRRVAAPVATNNSEINNVVVFLKDLPAQTAVPMMRAAISQKDEAFVPRVVAITTGSTVEFPNLDPYFHNVFSLSRSANFDLGRFPRGDSRIRKFTTPGLVKVYCHIHSHMSASIMVFDHDHFTIPSADGSFTLDGVTAGSYRLSAWHERIGESTQQIKIDPGGVARVEFSLPVHEQ
jgi:plastocyanin